ncbi:MAG: hypothetical protein GY953_35110, partial [bacterium]|nr:hypothetical protein [bacterium]
QLRKLYYPNPLPDGFYTGSTLKEPFVGLRENYYAWEWGDALFVVLDPFWYTPTPPESRSGSWSLTLGREQYDWLKQTLETSEATFKFVFAHNLVGGQERNGKMRGGIEAAKYFEWGGHEQNGDWGSDPARPGWAMPIHHLLVANNVTIFFHGHDHLFARQDLDGVVYQELPQPSHPNWNVTNRAVEYGYVNGDIVDGSGHLRLRVSPTEVTADYIRAWLPKDENQGRVNGEVAFSYTIPASRKRLTTTSAADFSSVVAPESIVSAFGEGLGGEVSVTVRDSDGTERAAEVLFGSANQVNFVVPAGTAVGVAAVTISADAGSSVTGDLFVHPVAPALFSAN